MSKLHRLQVCEWCRLRPSRSSSMSLAAGLGTKALWELDGGDKVYLGGGGGGAGVLIAGCLVIFEMPKRQNDSDEDRHLEHLEASIDSPTSGSPGFPKQLIGTGLGFRVPGLGFRVQGLGFSVPSTSDAQMA